MAIGGTFCDSMCKDGQGSITFLERDSGIFSQNPSVQIEIINWGHKIGGIGGSNFPLTKSSGCSKIVSKAGKFCK